MSIPHELLGEWAIHPAAYRQLLEVARDPAKIAIAEQRPHALMAHDGAPLDGARNVEMQGDIAIVHVKGTLGRYKNWYVDTSYGHLRKDLDRVVDDPAISSVLWVFDSPGGEVNSCAELADAIYAARREKPMVAYVGGLCASAAYFLASAVGEIRCSPTAVLGSIGVMTTLIDDTKMMTEIGLKEFEIVASQSPKKSQLPADADYRARVQQRIDDLAEVFIARVAQYRAVTPAMVLERYGQGDVMVGARAIEAGLADSISDFETVLASLAGRRGNSATFYMKGNDMEIKALARLLGLSETASDRQIEDRMHELSQLERDIVAATGAKNGDEAVGIAKAGVQAIGELNTLKAERAREQTAQVQAQFRATIKGALESGKLSLGEAASFIPTMMNDKAAEKAVLAIGGLKEQTAGAMLDALCSAEVSPKALVRVQAYLGSKASPVPAAAPPAEPAPTQQNRIGQLQVSAEVAAAYGLSAEDVARYGGIKNAEELLKKGAR